MIRKTDGFTLIELMIVIAIIGILSTMALPSFQDRAIRAQVEEAFSLARMAQNGVVDYYRLKKTMPADNNQAGLPVAEKIIGNYVTGVRVTNGAIDISLGNRINQNVMDKIITLRPAVVDGEPRVPIAWVGGYASAPNGMKVLGLNNTTLLHRHLPVAYRF